MYRAFFAIGCTLLGTLAGAVTPALGAAQDGLPKAPGPLEQLRAEYEQATNAWSEKYKGVRKTLPALLIERYDAWPGWSFAPQITKLGTADASAPHAFEALKWFIELANAVGSADRGYFVYDEQVCQALQRHHLGNPQLVELFGNLSEYPTPAREALLRECLDQAGTREVRGLACFHLAECLENKGRLALAAAAGWLVDDEFGQHMVGRHAPAFDAYVRLADSTLVLAEMKSLRQRVLGEFDDVPARRGHVLAPDKATLGQMVRLKDAIAKPVTVGQSVPELAGPDLAGQPRKLSDSLGRVIVLHFWATWSRQSVERIAQLRKLADEHPPKRLSILGLNCDHNRQAAANFAQHNALTWPSWEVQTLGESIGHFAPGNTWSAVFIIDAKGVLCYQDPADDELEKAVLTLLQAQAK